MKVHFTGWSNKYDEWVEENSPRLMRQWRRGQALQLNNRVDVQDVKGKWLEAQVIEIVPNNYIKVHFKGWSSKWDEFIPYSPDNFENMLD